MLLARAQSRLWQALESIFSPLPGVVNDLVWGDLGGGTSELEGLSPFSLKGDAKLQPVNGLACSFSIEWSELEAPR